MSEWIDAEAVKRASPLVDVVAAYGIALRRTGRALVGLCPFHADGGHPNLHVYTGPDPAGDNWFCFRCWSGGDVITFVMRKEGLGFADACARLSVRAGPPAGSRPPAGGPAARPPRRWDRLTLQEQVVMNAAAAVYRHCLSKEPRAMAYLQSRGVPDRVIRRGALGYADGHTLERFLRRRSQLGVAQDLGLLRRPERDDGTSRLRELLAGRIVVPEIRGGNFVWFIGRLLPDGRAEPDERPKYVGLPGERPVLGLERVVGHRKAFFVEGVFGYLVALGWDLPACSPCGTHLPADRLGFLARARTVYGLLDPDEAGRAAAARLGEQLGARWRPLWLPGGLELDDLALRPYGRATFFRTLAAARARARERAREATRAR